MQQNFPLENLRKHCLWLYGAYALSCIVCFYNWEMQVLCFFALLIAYYIVNKKHKLAEGTPYASHLQWLLRTFWIGSFYFLAGNIIMGLYIWFFTDLNAFLQSLGTLAENPDAMTDAMENYMQKNAGVYNITNIISSAPPTIWWLHRCWRGYALLKKDQPVENVMGWF